MTDSKHKKESPILRECHAFNLRQANLAVTALYDAHLKKAGITIQQYSVLRHIKELGPISITELSEIMKLDRTTLSRNITLLGRRDLLDDVPSSGRKRLLCLTRQGLTVFSEAHRYWQDAQEELEQRLGKTQVQDLEALLLAVLQ